MNQWESAYGPYDMVYTDDRPSQISPEFNFRIEFAVKKSENSNNNWSKR